MVLAVDRDGAYANLLLPRLLRERSITGTDAAFATELTYGTLRRSGGLDAVISAGARRDAATLDPAVRAVLRLGAYQLLHTRVPPHAAVSATVDLSREVAGPEAGRAGQRGAAPGRRARLGRLGRAARAARATRSAGSPSSAAIPAGSRPRCSTRSAATWPSSTARSPTPRPATHLVARPGRISRADLLADAGPQATAGPWSPYAVRLAGGDPAALAAIRDRRAGVQDEGSQLVALALARAPVEGRDAWWLDACAGPGGKASLLAGLLPAGARLLAADLAPHRAAWSASRSARSRDVSVVVADATRPAVARRRVRPGAGRRAVHRPGCAAPSARGAVAAAARGRRPAAGDPARAAARRALDSVRVGGVVAYATCSPHLAETAEVVDATLGGAPGRRGGRRPAAAARCAGPRPRPDGAAVAAPARDRCDVRRAASACVKLGLPPGTLATRHPERRDV